MTGTRLFKRAIIRISPLDEGENVADFLQGLVTNDVTAKMPVYAALLSAQGKAMFDFLVWPSDSGQLLLDCENEQAAALVKRLSLYRLRRKIGIEIAPEIAVHWKANSGDVGEPDPRLASLGQRWLAPATDTDKPADDDWLAHRLSLGVPEGAAELSDILWLETNAVELNGVSFEKGCYIGQENTARMNWRQKINRRLVVLPLEQSAEKRQKVAYSALDLAIDHLRVSDIPDDAKQPWLIAE